jgi:hypothetical protein
MSLAITLALAICLAMLLAGLMTNQVMVVFLAGFCWMCGTRRARQSAFLEGTGDEDWSGTVAGNTGRPDDAMLREIEAEMSAMEEGVTRAPRSLSSLETDTFVIDRDTRSGSQAGVRAHDEVEMDRILAKIGASGMSSLTEEEKRALKIMTARRRRRQ